MFAKRKSEPLRNALFFQRFRLFSHGVLARHPLPPPFPPWPGMVVGTFLLQTSLARGGRGAGRGGRKKKHQNNGNPRSFGMRKKTEPQNTSKSSSETFLLATASGRCLINFGQQCSTILIEGMKNMDLVEGWVFVGLQTKKHNRRARGGVRCAFRACWFGGRLECAGRTRFPRARGGSRIHGRAAP